MPDRVDRMIDEVFADAERVAERVTRFIYDSDEAWANLGASRREHLIDRARSGQLTKHELDMLVQRHVSLFCTFFKSDLKLFVRSVYATFADELTAMSIVVETVRVMDVLSDDDAKYSYSHSVRERYCQ